MEKSSRRLSSWLRVFEWIEANRYDVIEEAEKALSKKEGSPAKPDGADVRFVINHYCDAFKGRYGCNPMVWGKTAGQFKTLLKNMSAANLCELLTTYLQMNDQFFTTKRHSVDVFVTNLNSVVVARSTGRTITRKQAAEMESLDSSVRAAKEFLDAK